MSIGGAAGCRDKENGAYRYQRHQLENTLLYRVVERYYPEFTAYLAEQGALLPRYVEREFEAYLKMRPFGTWLSARAMQPLPC